jgi:hypothetical protein
MYNNKLIIIDVKFIPGKGRNIIWPVININMGCNKANTDPIKKPLNKREMVKRPGNTPASFNLNPSQRTNWVVKANAPTAAMTMDKTDAQVFNHPFVNADENAKIIAQLKQKSNTLPNVYAHWPLFGFCSIFLFFCQRLLCNFGTLHAKYFILMYFEYWKNNRTIQQLLI